MAVFLTVGCVELLLTGIARCVLAAWRSISPIQIVGGAAVGARRGLRAGLADQPARARRRALPGARHGVRPRSPSAARRRSAPAAFMAVYFAGLVVGNRRHRAAQLIDRFHDGLAWLAQMVMFVMLGLLVTPVGSPADPDPGGADRGSSWSWSPGRSRWCCACCRSASPGTSTPSSPGSACAARSRSSSARSRCWPAWRTPRSTSRWPSWSCWSR